jgi:serine protease Do
MFKIFCESKKIEMRKTVIYSGVVALLVSLLTIGAFLYLSGKKENLKIQYVDKTPAVEAKYNDLGEARVASLDFTQTAAKVMDGVVHIKSTMTNLVGQQGGPSIPEEFRDFFQRFFGQIPEQTEPVPQVGTGSGVIINENGYIVTNNHVVANASDIEVTLHDNRVFKAKVVGTDPTTDLALIRIKAEGLPTLPLANSNQVKVGEWVLAVGNPFNLNSTVTAGIISATGRNINILRDQYAIESFLQTDAAINPGNSGGALVNLDGGLVGINTAIASPTGAYSGYGFAVPSNIVNKVVEDLMKYGTVQRGYLGVGIRSVTAQLAEQENLDVVQGVYVDSLLVNSAAKAAGIKAGDVIT